MGGDAGKPGTIAAIREERGSVYGPPEPNHENIGLVFTALLQSHYDIRLPYPIPAYVAELMFDAFKDVRCARPVYRADSYLDGHNYKDFAQEAHEHWKKPE